MKKKLILPVIALITLSIFSSCTYEEVLKHDKPSSSSPTTEKTEVRLSSYITRSELSSSRLEGDYWNIGDAIGVFMIEKDSYAIAGEKSNVKYTAEKGGHTGNFAAKYEKIYFPEDGRKVRFMSYYPYRESIKNGIYNIDVTTQIPQSQLDLVYSFNSSLTYDKDNGSDNVLIGFKNQMTKIFIHVKNGEGLQGYDLMHMKVYLAGLSNKADFDLFSGEIKNLSGFSPIIPSRRIAGNGNVYTGEAVVIPTSDISNARIVIDLNNSKNEIYEWRLNKALEKGKLYTYNITVNRTGISVNPLIHNWNIFTQDQDE